MSKGEHSVSNRTRDSLSSSLTALHDAALLAAVFYAPIIWGQVQIPETHTPGQISASGGQALEAGLLGLAALAALAARWAQRRPPARRPNAIHLPALLLVLAAAVSTAFSVNHHVSALELCRLAMGASLFFLVANRALLPAPKPGLTVAAFACSVVLIPTLPTAGTTGVALKLFSVIGLGITVAVMVTQREDPNPIRWFRNALIISAALVLALFGWREKFAVARELEDTTWSIFGTFFNPNPLGGYLAMVCPMALAAAIASRAFTRKLLWGFCAALLAVTIVPTHSKGAMLAFAAAITTFALLLALQARRTRRVALVLLVAVGLLGVAGGIGVWRAEPLRTRAASALDVQSSSNMFRILTWKGTLRLAEAYPWTGVGPAAFKHAYPRYAVVGYVEAAHQDYLQMLAELGVFGGLTFLWLLGAVLFTGRRAIAASTDFRGRALAIGGTSSVVALMTHSLLEYDWYVGAVNFTFWLVAGLLAYQAHALAIGVAEPEQPRLPKRRSRTSAPPPPGEPAPAGSPFPWPADWRSTRQSLCWIVCCLLLTALAIAAVAVPARNALAQIALDTGDSYAMSNSPETRRATVGKYQEATEHDPGWAEAWERYGVVYGLGDLGKGVECLQLAHSLSPTSFRPYVSLGDLYEHHGRFEEAAEAYTKALYLFPNYTRTMKRLADLHQRMGRFDDSLRVWRRVVALENAPYNKYRALASVDVDTNFAYAHYELGLAAEQEGHRGNEKALPIARAEYKAALRIIADYFAKAKQTDDMFLMLRRPREHRAEEMRMLEAMVRWRIAEVQTRLGDVKQAEENRRLALQLRPDLLGTIKANQPERPR